MNVGLPRDIEWKGRTVRTAIWKEPVTGRRRVSRLNVDGDGRGDLAGHGGVHRPLFVYPIESHRYWEEQFQRTGFVAGSSARTSRSIACPTTWSASATGTGSAARCSKSARRG